jgi:hypothetical protein
MYINPTSSERTYTLDEAAQLLCRSRETIESLIRNEILGFEVGLYGPVITNDNLANFYLGRKPMKKPDYKPEKPKRKMHKYHVKAKTRR